MSPKKAVRKKVLIKSKSKKLNDLDFSKHGKRRQSRIYAMLALYRYDMNENNVTLKDLLLFNYQTEKISEKVYNYAKELIEGVVNNLELIDKHIIEGSTNWDLDRIHYIDRAILRFSIYSLLFEKSISKNVIIDEAVEITKIFSDKDSYKFINGILDGIN